MAIKIIALILGGGAGSRLYPLTKSRSKPAVGIGGKYRLIDIPISNCLNSKLRRMFVLTQYNSASLNTHIMNTYNFDMFSRGFVNILAAEQTPTSKEWFRGTADAVRQSLHHLQGHDYDYVLVLSGDQLYQMDFEKLAEFHVEAEADVTIATIPVNAKDASGFGIMKVDDDSMIESFIEKPSSKELGDWKSTVPEKAKKKKKEYLASMGIYVFKKLTLEKLFADHPDATDFGKEIIPDAIEEGYKVASYPFEGYWTDIGTISSFFEANLELADNLPEFNLFDENNPIYTRPRLLGPSKFFGTRLSKAVVAEGCFIHADAIEEAIIGIRSRIGSGTVVKRTVMMGNDYFETLEKVIDPTETPMGIGEDCTIENAILDKNCRIGDNVIIRGHKDLIDERTENYTIKDGIVVVHKGALISNGSRIGAWDVEKEEEEKETESEKQETVEAENGKTKKSK